MSELTHNFDTIHVVSMSVAYDCFFFQSTAKNGLLLGSPADFTNLQKCQMAKNEKRDFLKKFLIFLT